MRNRKEQSVKIAAPKIEVRPTTVLPSWRFVATILLVVAALLACVVNPARAQDPFGSDTPTPTAIPGGAAAIGEPTSMWTPSASNIKNSNPQVIQLPAPSIVFNVGGQPIFSPNRECSGLMLNCSHTKFLTLPSGSAIGAWTAIELRPLLLCIAINLRRALVLSAA
ncbi:MAG: hypothetical protein WA740_02935 [Candidatus Binataceae bacterium]